MKRHIATITMSMLAAAITLAATPSALAQMGLSNALRDKLAAPSYGSGTSAGLMSNSNFNTPESDGRPGAKAYKEGMHAYNHGDYEHAVHMLQVAASWAFKPAEYNLGVMYYQGEGVPTDRALGAAWLVLAAERGNPHYVAARDWVISKLSKAEFAQTDELWGQLKRTYGDAVALRRAKAQWAWVKTHQTGTRVGGAVGELRVGVPAAHGTFATALTSKQSVVPYKRHGWMSVLTGASTDGALTYRQFQQSDNPYDPIFLKSRNGIATVGPLSPMQSDGSKKKDQKKDTSQQPDQPPQNG